MIPDEDTPDVPEPPEAEAPAEPKADVPIDPATGECYKSGEVPLGCNEPVP